MAKRYTHEYGIMRINGAPSSLLTPFRNKYNPLL